MGYRTVIAGIVSSALVLIGVSVLSSRSRSIDDIAFDSRAWKAWNPNDIPPRGATAFTAPQRMINDLVSNHLVGKDKKQIEEMLGKSPTWDAERRHSTFNNVLSSDGTYYIRNGEGHYGDEYGWDFIYEIGPYYPPAWLELFGADSDKVDEQLVIRLDENERFESWYIVGSPNWQSRVGKEAAKRFRQTRHGY